MLVEPVAAVPEGPRGQLVVPPEPPAEPPAQQRTALDEDFDRVLEGLGLTESDLDTLPAWDLPGWQLVLAIVGLAVVVLILRAIYRGMQHSRLHLRYHSNRPPTVTWPAVRRYLWTPLVFIPLWFFAILLILIAAAKRGDTVRPGEEVLLAAAVIVGASRLLAHVNREAAHELAKAVPLTLITLILVSGQTVSLAGFVLIVALLVLNMGSLMYYLLLLAALDVAFTAIWVWLRRGEWRREHDHKGTEPHGRWSRVWRTLSQGWASTESGPSGQPTPVTADSDPSAVKSDLGDEAVKTDDASDPESAGLDDVKHDRTAGGEAAKSPRAGKGDEPSQGPSGAAGL